MIKLKSAAEIARMREAGRILAQVMEQVRQHIRPGVTTAELDALAEELIRQRGAIPSFKGYRGFPATACISVNEEVVHGIPGPRVLREGDIVSLDMGTIWQGYQADMAITVGVGEISPEARRLIEVTQEALQAAIAQAHPGKRLGDISWAIQRTAERHGYNVVREYTSHGIGREMHEDPQILNFGRPGRGIRLRRGMTFALEPMLTMGDWHTRVLDDGWTVVTADGKLSAHFEHTIAIGENGPEVLTLP